MWFDTHCHLDFSEFISQQERYNKLFNQNNLARFFVPSVGPNNWKSVLGLASEHLRVGLGIHPCFLPSLIDQQTVDEDLECLRRLAFKHRESISAIGECGLDKRIDTPISIQSSVFSFQVDLAEQLQLPLVIHSVQQHHNIQESLKSRLRDNLGVVHAFSGNYQQAKAFVDLGLKIGVGGVITWPTAQKTREAIAKLPLDSIVLETDAPDMRISGRQREPNSPHLIPIIFNHLAALRSENPSILAEQIWKNSIHLFSD
ncbi:deoxyribonuclease [Vibrio inusitatus NBRC 102082]|uniref:Deoxyribonuclease n=1 Tax=Vibrio inusitatus NBRC 102082 TaxID=1219070 RepID=A0A4Y3HVQ4_9VIBR|nr:TatD family hydrolase [Vibrio inusitatus]GEA51085.1 deoxyribonuclease [Vibrio inusitatus NBRC 102082]